MPQSPGRLSRFWRELKRRNVLRSLAIYAGTAFIILEASTIIFPRWNFPDWSIDLVLWLLILGAFINIIIAWIYDITPGGVQRTKPLEETKEIGKTTDSRGWKAATYISLVVIAALVVFNIFSSTKTLKAGDIQSLLILPFDNFPGDDQLEYFVSGMYASLIGDMGRISGLRVISKTSSRTYQNVDMSIYEIASELNVDAVVEPTVMCLGDSICLQIRVITPFPEERQLWIAEYKEEKNQILNLYNRITKQIANEVMIELTPEEERLLAKNETVDIEAYDAFMRSYKYWGDLSKEGLDKAFEYLILAIEKDPDWAPLYAGLAQVWVGRLQMGMVETSQGRQKIHENINKAFELDPDFADSHFINGIISTWTDWNWEKGEKEFLIALALNPNDVMSRMYYAHLLMILQRNDEALTQGRLAVDLDPLNPLILGLYSVVLKGAGKFQECYDLIQKGLSIDPENGFTHGQLGRAYYNLGEYDKMFEQSKKRLSRLFEPEVIQTIDSIYKKEGFSAAYEKIVRQWELYNEKHYKAPGSLAWQYYIIGEYENALDDLEAGCEMHEPNMPYIATGIRFEALHDSARFIAILDKMNLPCPPL